jgi:hypothetical protein
MTSAQRREDAAESTGKVPTQGPGWLGKRVRLPVLVTCLGIAIFALLTSHSSILSPTSASSAAAPATCGPPTPPPLRKVSGRQLEALRASLLIVMARLSRSRYEWGTVSPEVAWTDNSPQSISASETDGLWPASYEMRSWVTDPLLAPERDDIAADVFLFADSAHARRFFAEATGTRCHRHGTEQPASEPPYARNLIWVNPDGVTQEDVLLLRGPRVYRIVDVRPTTRSSAEQQAGVSRVNALACALADANCVTQARSADATGPRGSETRSSSATHSMW